MDFRITGLPTADFASLLHLDDDALGALSVTRLVVDAPNAYPLQSPEQQRRRLLSVRAYDHRDWMVDAEVKEGRELESLIDRFLADPKVRYLHVHNARPGCYACRVDRA